MDADNWASRRRLVVLALRETHGLSVSHRHQHSPVPSGSDVADEEERLGFTERVEFMFEIWGYEGMKME